MNSTYTGTIKSGQVKLDVPLTWPEGSQVHIILVPVVNQRSARRKANVWLMEQVGNVVVKNLQLIQRHGQAIWHGEVFITLPHQLPLGPIGQVEVNATTGQVLNSAQSAEEMIACGAKFTPTA